MKYGRFNNDEWRAIAHAHNHYEKTEVKQFKQFFLVNYHKPTPVADCVEWTPAFRLSEFTTVMKVFFPYHFDEESWTKFKAMERMDTYSTYDCSGKLFTVSMEKHEIDSGTWVYHYISIDC